MPPFVTIHPKLPPLRLTSRHQRLYTGPCPFCADGGTDRFHLWMDADASSGRPAERFWCRVCNTSGLLAQLDQPDRPDRPDPRAPRAAGSEPGRSSQPRSTDDHRVVALPHPDAIPAYRQLYAATALWAHAWLLDGCHPEPRAYLHARGLTDATISRYLLGVTLRDPDSLVQHLRATCPDAVSHAEAAGLLVTDATGRVRTHWNLTGRIVFPYIADGEVVDLRTRRYDGGKGYRSLGPYEPRGARFPFGWDAVTPGTTTVIVTEAEFKALAALQAYHDGKLDAPTIGQPGLTLFRDRWAQALRARGVTEVVLCYDSQPRTVTNGVPLLTPEEQWCLRHGAVCAAAGLQVRVARLPLHPGQEKEEIDTFLLRAGATRFQQLIDQAPLLDDYHRSISSAMLERHQLTVPHRYPLRRPRPTRLSLAEAQQAYGKMDRKLDEGMDRKMDRDGEAQATTGTLAEARAAIVEATAAHTTSG